MVRVHVRSLRSHASASVQTGSGAGRWFGARFGLFAAAVCVQVLCWVFDMAQKLPTLMAEAIVTSGACARA